LNLAYLAVLRKSPLLPKSRPRLSTGAGFAESKAARREGSDLQLSVFCSETSRVVEFHKTPPEIRELLTCVAG